MALRNLIFRRAMSIQQQQRQRPSIGQVFVQEDVQTLLKEITRYSEDKIFSQRIVHRLKSPKMMFMTDEDLKRAKENAYHEARARLQMPPVMDPDNSEPRILSKDEELVGYSRFRVLFVDISPGQTKRSRLMSIRERDGTLRFPTHVERSRLNHIFYPQDSASVETPRLFEENNMIRLLQDEKYKYILDRACVQFEPDDPRYVHATTRVYNFVDSRSDFDKLRSTRHFGPMSLYLAYNKQIDNLLLEMFIKQLVEDAVKLVRLYNICHNIDTEEQDDLEILKNYAENHSRAKYNLDLALQDLVGKTK
ncbi:uncharacterized protein LOC143867430, partial [Tasmannia lanceolata]|uniref:uncharacterized protein LOC143867430 n=1 Tax=Tasmannia lanceolata TaxID=3420 RepID=UPI0040630ABC